MFFSIEKSFLSLYISYLQLHSDVFYSFMAQDLKLYEM